MFCCLQVLGFISLKYSSLQVHVLRILILHYKRYLNIEYEQEIETQTTDKEIPVS
jgi:hypothetical protein